MSSPPQTLDIDHIFAAMADPQRRTMVERLSHGSATVSQLAAPLTMRLPSAVKHLKILEEGGLVQSTKAGRTRTYSLNKGALDTLDEWVRSRESAWNVAFDRLDAAMQELQKQDPEK